MRLSLINRISFRGFLREFRHFHLSLLLLILYIARAVTARVCFNFEEEMRLCAKKYNLPVPNDQPVGYDFGFGSLNETEEMCRNRGHITIFQCMQQILDKKCRNNAEERYLKTIWSFTLDTRRSEQAATYLCKEHNLQILRRHRNGCLRVQEKRAETCTQTKNSTMSEVVTALRRESAKSYPTPEIYLERLKLILETYECKSIKAKLDCLYDLLRDTCHPDATLLILNYFKETLPPDCIYSPTTGPSETLPKAIKHTYTSPYQQIPPRSADTRSQKSEVMSDFPHSRYVNDGFYDEWAVAYPPSSCPFLGPSKVLRLVTLMILLVRSALSS